MQNARNLKIYRWLAPVYDVLLRPFFRRARRRAFALLAARAGERVLLPGVGTGQDLEWLAEAIQVTAVDLSPAMLARARAKARGDAPRFSIADAQNLPFADDAFDAIVCNLILSVVPAGASAFREAWRVLRPGGRAIIFDKFLAERDTLTLTRRVQGKIISALGTDPNRRLSDILADTPGVSMERDEPSLLRGQYRILVLRKVE
jgi:ubiquinone/menaquinone biosynthesis C-methylase UbiE